MWEQFQENRQYRPKYKSVELKLDFNIPNVYI